MARRLDPRVDLGDRTREPLLQPVLLTLEVADLRDHSTVLEDVELVLAELLPVTDLLNEVGVVHDLADFTVDLPDLHTLHSGVGAHRVAHDPGQSGLCDAVEAVDHAVGDAALHQTRVEPGQRLGLLDGLRLGELPDHGHA